MRLARRQPDRSAEPPWLPDRRRPGRGGCPPRALGRPTSGRDYVTVPSDLLSSIGISIAVAAVLAVIGWRLRQPLILAYLVTGVVIAPVAFHCGHNQHSVHTLAYIGLL